MKYLSYLVLPCPVLLMMLAFLFAGGRNTSDDIVDPSQPAIPRADMAEVEAGIRAHIERETARGDGYFHLTDGGQSLRLKLVRVHTEYLSNLGPGRYFACVDLADVSGDVFDVDFFMEGSPGAMEVTELSLHKLNGKPFYSWKQQQDKTWFKVPMAQSTNDLLGIVEGRDSFTFFYRAILPALDGPARLWIPIAGTDAFQEVEVLGLQVPGRHRMIREKRFGNQVLLAELEPRDGGKPLEIVYRVRRQEKSAWRDPATQPDGYLKADRMVPVGGRFAEIAAEVLAGKDNEDDLLKARALYDHIIDQMRYMKFGDYGRGDAQYACDTKTGNCTEFHSFFISLARSAGIPARFAIGASIPSDRDDGGMDGYHCWAEFYADGQWWPVDISEGNKYSALASYYFGRHPANRLEISRGRDLLLDPGPASGPLNFLVYPLIEAGGQSRTVLPTFTFLREHKPGQAAID
jgi:transglutaminase-like putative cysteine protease